jgi:hypothetical protein
LAERLLNQLCGAPKKGAMPTIDPAKRLLDPACGSGTFLVLAIRRMRNWAEERMMPEHEALEKILANVVGFDLNPLAVISARTNYLLALGDLIQHRLGEISIPVYLADSIMTPSTGQTLFEQDRYTFSTAVGKFSVPLALVDAQEIDRLASLLEESVGVGLTGEQFQRRAGETFPALEGNQGQLAVATGLYERLKELDEQGINGIWARVIKNAFAPLFQGRFDYVMGNPPWVNWESLPEEYRKATIPLWHHHGMVPRGGLRSILGESKMDISMLMTYVAMDDYLRDGAKLGFLITQSVFKTSGAGQGFRRFVLGSGVPIAPLVVDDMSELKPFSGASNRTAILVLRRNHQTTYPVPYTYWRGEGRGRTIPEHLSWEEASDITRRLQFVAEPVDRSDPTSPWITGRRRALDGAKKVRGPSEYEAHAGAYTGGANAVYWMTLVQDRPDGLAVVRNIAEGARRKVPEVETAVEVELLYPLLRGRDVGRWQAAPSAYILMTKPQWCREKAIPEAEMRLRFPKAYSYLKRVRPVLEQRRDAVLIRSGESIPFYSIGAVADYTFAPHKVVWRYIATDLMCAVVSRPRHGVLGHGVVIPDHRLMTVQVRSADEAHYLCAVLNSSAARFVVRAYAIGTQISTHVLDHVAVANYQATEPRQRQLGRLSRQAHEATLAADTARVKEIEEEIDQLAAELWGLTPQELSDIKRSLEELS